VRRILIGTGAGLATLVAAGVAIGQIGGGVPGAQPATGTQPNLVARGFTLHQLAIGSDPLENPAVPTFKTYGYLENADPNSDPLARTRTEPDENTYLVTRRNPGGPTDGYDYGRHFLIQGHENGSSKAYLTRINLDVKDPDHRITLLDTPASDGTTSLSSMDGSTYGPFDRQLLFTSENSSLGGVVSTPLRWRGTDVPPLTHLDGSLGKGGYEGIRPDSKGNLYIVEDVGGSGVVDQGVTTKVKQPNSFVYRFKPTRRWSLSRGKLQALQTAEDGDDPFDANKLAKAAGATPLKRPENGAFVPGSRFRSFVLSETGDTDKTGGDYPGAAERGAWGALLRIDMKRAGARSATVRAIELGDETHNSFDNVTFLNAKTLLVCEDRGDTLHEQEGVLDSVWSFDLRNDVDEINGDAKRLVALGRDPESLNSQHEDNEPTGILVSDGSSSVRGLLGTRDPADERGVRIFLTRQHGQNVTYRIKRAPGRRRHR
jgi:hypothetical protein